MTRRIGDLETSDIGLGCLHLSSRRTPLERSDAISVIHAALDSGITLLDTADAYTPSSHLGHNEVLVREALSAYADIAILERLIVATKGGFHRGEDGTWILAGRPEQLVASFEASLQHLGVERIDLYQLHRPDPAVPFDDQIGTLLRLRDEGKIANIGLSNVDLNQVRRGNELTGGLAAVQNEMSPWWHPEDGILDYCTQMGIAFLPYSPLGGRERSKTLHSVDTARKQFAVVAAAHEVSAQQVALAWLLGLSPIIVPIPGATRTASVTDCANAMGLLLTTQDRELLATSVGTNTSSLSLM